MTFPAKDWEFTITYIVFKISVLSLVMAERNAPLPSNKIKKDDVGQGHHMADFISET